jgi:fructose-bisphosphate aldolase class 1
MKPANPHILTINGGSSSIKFAMFESGDSLQRILEGILLKPNMVLPGLACPKQALAFSYARAFQQKALEIWQGKEANVPVAQQALVHRARCNRAERRGEYNASMERT